MQIPEPHKAVYILHGILSDEGLNCVCFEVSVKVHQRFLISVSGASLCLLVWGRAVEGTEETSSLQLWIYLWALLWPVLSLVCAQGSIRKPHQHWNWCLGKWDLWPPPAELSPPPAQLDLQAAVMSSGTYRVIAQQYQILWSASKSPYLIFKIQ